MLNKLTDELAVCGLNAALAVAEHHPETINRLFLREDRLNLLTAVCKKLAERKRPYKLCDDEELERICKSVHHQGVVVMIEEPVIEPLTFEDLDCWAQEGKIGLLLHSVENDHNLGAIARAAAFFDAHFLVINERDQEARLTTSAYRIAEGGMEHIVVRKVGNTAAFLKDASQRIITVATDVRARLRIGDLGAILAEKQKKLKISGRAGIVVALGNEDSGLPVSVKNRCSCVIRIPGIGNIQSLNVAQTAALFLHELYEL
jgi:TrmH RNA methyltransferase